MCWVTVGTVLAGQWSVWSAGTGAEELQKEAGGAGIQPVNLASRSASDAAEPCGLGEANVLGAVPSSPVRCGNKTSLGGSYGAIHIKYVAENWAEN